jgi:hypothetical protein
MSRLVQCNVCEMPDSPKLPLKICSRCRCARYCSVDHQKQDWPTHKLVCSTLEPVEFFLQQKDLIHRDVFDLSTIFANQENVGKLLKWIQNEPPIRSDTLISTQILPHVACELILSDFGLKYLIPIVFDHYLTHLFRFFDQNQDKEKPRDGSPINAGFLLLLMNLNKHKRKHELMHTILNNNQLFLKSLLFWIHFEEIRILVTESFQYLPGNGSKLLAQIFVLAVEEKYSFASNQLLIALCSIKFAGEIKTLIGKRFKSIHELKEGPFEHFLGLIVEFQKRDAGINVFLDDLIELMKNPPGQHLWIVSFVYNTILFANGKDYKVCGTISRGWNSIVLFVSNL